MQAEWIPTGWPVVNYLPGRAGNKIDMITLHWMAGYMAGSIATFKKPNGASAHRLIAGSRIVQMVDHANTAFHASNLAVNRRAIGIEHEGGYPVPGGLAAPSEETIQASIRDCTDLCREYGINPLELVDVQWWNPATRKVEGRKVYRIHSHHEVTLKVGSTQCSGSLPVERIRNAVAANLGLLPRQVPVESPSSDFTAVRLTMKVIGTAGTGLNVRSQATSKSSKVKSYRDNDVIAVDGYTNRGESVGGNTRWYRIAEGQWLSAAYVVEVAQAAAVESQAQSREVYYFTGDLTPGMTANTQVARMQKALKSLGHFPQNVEATGNYFDTTGKAVLAFQKATDDPDRPGVKIMPANAAYGATFGAGWLGPKTRAALNSKKVPVT